MISENQAEARSVRDLFVRGLSLVEDTVYVGLGFLLTVVAIALLVVALRGTLSWIFGTGLHNHIIELLDQMLAVFLVIELLYTVQVSFREHGLVAEPFLVVALIAVIRRVLVITAEFPKLSETSEPLFRHAMWELGLLTFMILILVGALIALQRQSKRLRQNEKGDH
jgi:uncharacterized membrane protein (DUF373 family)